MKILVVIWGTLVTQQLAEAQRWSVGKTVVFLLNQECNISYFGIQSGFESSATTFDFYELALKRLPENTPIQIVMTELEKVINEENDLGIKQVFVYKPNRLASIARNAHFLHSSIHRFWIHKTPVDPKQLAKIIAHSPSLKTIEIWSSKTGKEVLPILARSKKLKKVTINFTKIKKEDFRKVNFRKDVAIEVQYPWPNGKGHQRWHRDPGQGKFKFIEYLSSPPGKDRGED